MFIGNWIIRFKATLVWLSTLAGVAILHLKLLHLSDGHKDLLEFACLVIIAFNKPVASQMQERK